MIKKILVADDVRSSDVSVDRNSVILADKINEIIDVVNKEKEKKRNNENQMQYLGINDITLYQTANNALQEEIKNLKAEIKKYKKLVKKAKDFVSGNCEFCEESVVGDCPAMESDDFEYTCMMVQQNQFREIFKELGEL